MRISEDRNPVGSPWVAVMPNLAIKHRGGLAHLHREVLEIIQCFRKKEKKNTFIKGFFFYFRNGRGWGKRVQ